MIRITIILLQLGLSTSAQDTATAKPVVGKPIQDFEFTDIAHYTQTKARISDFRGRWLVLDLWNRYCSGCMAKMPLVDSMRQEFNQDVSFLLVGYTGTLYRPAFPPDDKEIRELYEDVRVRRSLHLPVAFDSTLFHRFDVGPCPYIVIVDPHGIVRGLTSSLNRCELGEILSQRPVTLRKVNTKTESQQLNRQNAMRREEAQNSRRGKQE